MVVIVEACGNLGDFPRSQRIKKYVAGSAAVSFGVGDPQAVRRPTSVGNRAVVGLTDEHGLLVVKTDVPKPEHFIPVEKLLAVRRPHGAVTIDASIAGDACFRAAHLRARVEFELAGFVGEISDGLS